MGYVPCIGLRNPRAGRESLQDTTPVAGSKVCSHDLIAQRFTNFY